MCGSEQSQWRDKDKKKVEDGRPSRERLSSTAATRQPCHYEGVGGEKSEQSLSSSSSEIVKGKSNNQKDPVFPSTSLTRGYKKIRKGRGKTQWREEKRLAKKKSSGGSCIALRSPSGQHGLFACSELLLAS